MAIRSILYVTVFHIVLLSQLIALSLGQVNVTTIAPLITTVNTSNATNITTATMMVNTTEVPRTTIFTTMNITTQTTATTTTTTKMTTTTTARTTTRGPNRKFDGLSFIGGMILTVGLTAIIYLVVTYMRRQKAMPYANLH